MKNRKITRQEAEAATAADFKLFLFSYSFEAIMLYNFPSYHSYWYIWIKLFLKIKTILDKKGKTDFPNFQGRGTDRKLKKKLGVTYLSV